MHPECRSINSWMSCRLFTWRDRDTITCLLYQFLHRNRSLHMFHRKKSQTRARLSTSVSEKKLIRKENSVAVSLAAAAIERFFGRATAGERRSTKQNSAMVEARETNSQVAFNSWRNFHYASVNNRLFTTVRVVKMRNLHFLSHKRLGLATFRAGDGCYHLLWT